MAYLVDTDWLIDYQRNVAPVVDRLRRLIPSGVGVSIISVAELYDGVFGSDDPPARERWLTDFLTTGFEILEVDWEICRIFARERGRLRTAGMLIPDFDLMIGATALRYNLTLLTNNRRHFERLTGLHIVSA